MAEILAAVRKETNGAAASDMEKRGILYPLNFGVAAHAVKKICIPYGPDASLADLLIRQEIRELQLAAVFVADGSSMDREKAERWAGYIRQEELMNHAAMALFHRSPEAEIIAGEWLDTDLPLLRNAALRIYGQLIRQGSATEETAAKITGNILDKIRSGQMAASSDLEFCLIGAARRSEAWKKRILHALEDPDMGRDFAEIAALVRYA